VRILVTGSRDWDDEAAVRAALTGLVAGRPGPHVVVHGACPTGGDAIADRVAAELGLTVERHPARWRRYGRTAGYRRNAEMVALGADVCLAFIRDASPGASMTAHLADEARIPTRRITATSTPATGTPAAAVGASRGSGS
jgi:hypothetical protein